MSSGALGDDEQIPGWFGHEPPTASSTPGEGIIDSYSWRSYFLFMFGLIALMATLTSAGQESIGAVLVGAVTTVVLLGFGIVVVVREHRAATTGAEPAVGPH